MPKLNLRWLGAGACFLLFFSAPASADWMNFAPLFEATGKQPTRLELSGGMYSNSDVVDQDRTLDRGEHRLSLSVPVSQSPRGALSFRLDSEYRPVFSDAEFKNDLPDVPDNLYRLMARADGVLLTQGGATLGASGGFGTASDSLFESSRELVYEGAVFCRTPMQSGQGWIFAVHFSNNRNYLHRFPLPGVMYSSRGREAFNFTFGFPVSAASLAVSRNLKFRLAGFIGRELELLGEWKVEGGESFIFGVDWRQTGYLRHGRISPDRRLYFDEKRAFGGLWAALTEGVGFSARAGLAFDRYLFQGSSIFDRERSEPLELGAAIFGSLHLVARF